MFKTLPGFREFYPEEFGKKSYIVSRWRNVSNAFAFQEFEPPVLEPLELFTEKSGEEIKSQLFEFTDKGGRGVSLRPEMTPSLARMVGSVANGIRRPVKWFCIGENYRYERQQKGRLRAFYQYNADILGDDTINADAEIIALLIESLKVFGLTKNEFKLRLGDRNLWILFLNTLGIVDDYVMKVLSVIDKIERVNSEVFRDMMAKALDGLAYDIDSIIVKCKEFVGIKDFGGLEKAFGDSGGACISQRLLDWKNLLSRLSSMGYGDFVSVDMGIVRGLAYYTGFVFEAFQVVGTGRALAGGGRYDNLVKKLGYVDMPAVGFGMGDVTVSDLLELVGKQGNDMHKPLVFAIIGSEDLRNVAISAIFDLRRRGISVDYSFKSANFGKQFKQADSVGAKYAIIFGEEEIARNEVKVKNLSDGTEQFVKIDNLIEVL